MCIQDKVPISICVVYPSLYLKIKVEADKCLVNLQGILVVRKQLYCIVQSTSYFQKRLSGVCQWVQEKKLLLKAA